MLSQLIAEHLRSGLRFDLRFDVGDCFHQLVRSIGGGQYVLKCPFVTRTIDVSHVHGKVGPGRSLPKFKKSDVLMSRGGREVFF